ncbi:MAG: amidohydrolase family protein [Rhodospirillales bacterium]|jgi:2-pyrone-4,6-dicarboxylate lactonase|nr:amidohydrolase family protein [Rhodospirillales bacterium]
MADIETGGQATKEAPYCTAYHPDSSSPLFPLPAGACDTHAHICGPEKAFPYDPARIYTPPDALLPAYEHMLGVLGVERMVLVQPSVYGNDNRVMLGAMREASVPARGVAVVPMDIEQAELEELHEAGVRGVRFNLVDVKDPSAGLPVAEITAFAGRIAPMGWHVELLIHVDDYPEFGTMFLNFPTEIVVGHIGYFRPGCGLDHPGFQGLVNLAESGLCWVKFTGPYRISAEEFPYGDVDRFAEALVARAPHRLLWGSDWPHVMMKKTMPDDGPLADVFARWVPETAIRRQILVDNPARLYQFEK